MAKVIALRCPNCGGYISREQNKCNYCGADVIISTDGSCFSLRSQSKCPKCGAVNEASSWFCANCGTILTRDVDMLKELQKKIRFEQKRTESCMAPSMKEKLEPDEFIYYVFYWTKGGDRFYAITDKRIIKSRAGKYEEAPLSEVVSIGDPQVKTGFFSVSSFFEVNTFNKTMVFDGFGVGDAAHCGKLCGTMRIALENHNLRKKDIRAVILSLNLE